MPMRWRWPPAVQAHLRQRAVHPRRDLGRRRQLVHLERFGQDLAQALARVERGLRILEDHLHAQDIGKPVGAAQLRRRAALVQQLAGALAVQAGDHPSQGRFAAAGFAHQAQHFAAAHRQRYAVDGMYGMAVQRLAGQRKQTLGHVGTVFEALVDIAQFDNGQVGGRHAVAVSLAMGT